ncbi:MAG: hypothetical protein IJT11_06725 [Bacteroidaceae bacterium]|nr:hypothetical protein [Bacteroidaceae bacterium]
MKKDYQVNELRASDFAYCLRPFWANAKSVSDANICVKLVLIAIVCFTGLAPRLRVKYHYDYNLSMMLLNLLCIGPTGKGKGVVHYIVNLLMRQLMERDEKERAILAEYKKENRRKGANQKKDEEPLVAIRYLQKFTLPVAVKYCDMIHRKYGDWLPFFLYADELGSFIANKSGNAEFQSVARTAYNLGEIYSRDTLYEGGWNARVDINWSSVMCGQETALSKYINKEGLLLGDAGRQIIIKLGEQLGEEAPTIRPFTKEQERCISDAINRLMRETFTEDDQLQPTHEVDMSWLEKDVVRWCDRQREIITKSGSRAHDSFYGRASKSAFVIATMVYHLFDEDPARQKNVRRIYWYFAQYILNGLMAQWGQQFETALPKDKEAQATKPTLFDVMPKRFTRTQLREKIAELELGTPARQFLFQWLKRKWIYEVEGQPDTYEKIYD